MGFVDAAIVLGVFAAFGFMILAKMKEKNHPIYKSISSWMKKSSDKNKDSTPKNYLLRKKDFHYVDQQIM